MKSGEALVVGSVAYDGIITPYEAREDVLGGSATYFSIAASRLCRPKIVAVVGQDFLPGDREFLSAHGVDLAGLEEAEGACFRWKGRYHEGFNPRETIYTELNVFEHFHPVLPDAYRSTPTVFLANIHPDLQHEVLDAVDNPRLVVADTMNLWIDITRESLMRLLPRLDVLVINDEEARLISGEWSLPAAIRAVAGMGPKALVVKKGEHGAILAEARDHELFLTPAFPLDVIVDPTGAGDSFAGGFVGHLARLGHAPSTHDLRRAMLIGTVVASFTVEGFGVSSLAGASASAMNARLDEFQRMLRIAEVRRDERF